MFPFDSPIATGVLIVSMVVVYVLILKKLRPKPIRTSKVTSVVRTDETRRNLHKPIKREKKIQKPNPEITEPEKSDHVCFRGFGYLSTLPKNAALPDQCLGCPKIIECLKRAETWNRT